MRGNPGKIYETKDGKLVIAFHEDQTDELLRQGKIVVEAEVPGNTLFPELNNDFGTWKKVTIERSSLIMKGYID